MTNRLISEKSPYLLQHAHNPVDWYSWGAEAFAKARTEDKPIFLSVGYSTCHWCHVMEHESFENESIARLLNDLFVPIKVDREERPDVDRVYMTALQAMGENGGWPLTMFLTPELKPFYGGTYFPPEGRYGRAGLPDVLRKIGEVWGAEREKVEQSAQSITEFLHDVEQSTRGVKLPDKSVIDLCFDQIQKTFDETNGGFGTGAKFPRPVTLEFLLRYYQRTGVLSSLSMVEKTLHAMASGGIRDHVGGGFHRYAIDPEWRVPHFEKMAYDQAQLISVFLNAHLVTHEPAYADVVRSSIGYLLRDLRNEVGGFCSAEDADSPKQENPKEMGEGAFYLWTRKEILELLGEGDGSIFALRYGIEEDGNALVDPQHEFIGKNILYEAEDIAGMAKILGKQEDELLALFDRCRHTLLVARSRRPRPLRDDKVLTAWNGLLLSALVRAGAALTEPSFVEAAKRSAEFLLSRLTDQSTGRLYRRFCDGEARFEAHLQDYAFVIQGFIDLFEVTGEVRWLTRSTTLAHLMISLFYDNEQGGFFETTGEDQSVLARLKEHYDGAEPSGNSVAIISLQRLATLTGKPEWREIAERSLAAFSSQLERQPVAVPNMASALDQHLEPSQEIVLVGEPGDTRMAALEQVVRTRYLPNAVIVRIDPSQDQGSDGIAPLAHRLPLVNGQPAVYVCENFTCQLPATEPSQLTSILNAGSSQ